ncbi:hypothetical protein PIB30_094588 [Stylosanthes scabra]|uniref:Uncharacterized protein n=1 Tax=Stylosanthes scabra TaxID=79078 RepID=A0ABU6TUZ7_9FABA|nr:hypothetical protein [Stylosanthes scabra]
MEEERTYSAMRSKRDHTKTRIEWWCVHTIHSAWEYASYRVSSESSSCCRAISQRYRVGVQYVQGRIQRHATARSKTELGLIATYATARSRRGTARFRGVREGTMVSGDFHK